MFNDTATTEIYTLSLHDALPISHTDNAFLLSLVPNIDAGILADHCCGVFFDRYEGRSEEHTSELQSRRKLVCRLLLEKKNYCRALTYYFKNLLCVEYVTFALP